jgi:hypothetical protein
LPLSSHSVEQQGSVKKVGKKLAAAGYKAKYPLCLIPGFASSALRVEEGGANCNYFLFASKLTYYLGVNQRIWIDLARLGGESVKNKFRLSSKNKPEDEDEGVPIVSGFKNEWLAHMSLDENGHSDPPSIRVRPILGVDGLAYLCPGLLTSAVSFVFGPLIEELAEIGYSESEGNILAMPYDW